MGKQYEMTAVHVRVLVKGKGALIGGEWGRLSN